MRLPHDRLQMRVLGQWASATGLAITAALTIDGAPVATIHDHGDGTGAQLQAHGSGGPGMAEYLAGCRLYGAPVDQRPLLDALVDEHYLFAAQSPRRTPTARPWSSWSTTQDAPTPHVRYSRRAAGPPGGNPGLLRRRPSVLRLRFVDKVVRGIRGSVARSWSR